MDLTTMTNEELLGYVQAQDSGMSESFDGYCQEILRRMNSDEPDVFVLPVAVTEAIRNQFGNGRKTFDAVTKRVRFAYQVWQGKYAPWTPEQADYAEELCVFAINKATLASNPGHARASVYTWLDRIIHHEKTDLGFKNRRGAMVDITDELARVF